MDDPLQVLEERAALLRWLRNVARDEWQIIYDHGTRFLAPPETEHLTGAALLGHLVDAETARLRAADLYHVDAGVLRRAVAQVATMPEEDVLTPQDMPSPRGLLVWDGTISTTTGGSPVIAVSWEVRPDETVWVSWWSDAVATAKRWVQGGQLPPATAQRWLAQRGNLQYERERLLPFTGDREDPLTIPVAYDETVSAKEAGQEPVVRAMTRITIATWRLIADKVVQVVDVAPAPAVRQRLTRAGLPCVVHAAHSG